MPELENLAFIQPGRPWTNWFANQYFVPTFVARPRSEEDVRALVRFARRRKLAVRAQGATHSCTPLVPTSGILVDFDAFSDVVSVDRSARRVTVRPGMRVGDLSRYLRQQGMSLRNQGDIDTQAIAGAMMTATHGAGRTLPCMSDQLVSARIVTAGGEVMEISAAGDGEVFRAFRVSIGMLGLIVSLTIQAVESYDIRKTSWNTDTEDCLEKLPDLLDRNRTFWFFWLPREESAALYELPGGAVPSTATRSADICHMRAYNAVPAGGAPPALGPGEQFGHSSEIFPNQYTPNFREMEYAVPFASFETAFLEVRHLMKTKYLQGIFPVECRAVAADDSFLSPYAGRDGYAISVSGSPAENSWPMLQDVDAILDRHQGRPHWGKHHFMSAQRLERLYPGIDSFRRIRRALDPDGMFLNDHLRALFA